GGQALIVSSDRDAIQLVGTKATLLQPTKGVTATRRMTPAAVQPNSGLPQHPYPHPAHPEGEATANLPALPAVGPKAAATVPRPRDQGQGRQVPARPSRGRRAQPSDERRVHDARPARGPRPLLAGGR